MNIDPSDLMRTVVGRWRLIAAAGIAAAGIAAAIVVTTGVEPAQPQRATATIAMTEAGHVEGLRLATLAVLTTEGPVRERAAATLGELPSQDLASRVSVSIDEPAGVLSITARDTDPRRAEATAAAFANGLVDEVARRQGESHAREIDDAIQRLESLESEVERLDRRIARTEDGSERDLLRAERDALVRRASFAYEASQALADGGPSQHVELLRVGDAVPDGSSLIAPRSPFARVALAGLFGLLLGTLGALVVERLDARIRSRRQAEHVFGLPVIAEVSARRKRLEIVRAPSSAESARYRLIREAFAPRTPVSANGSAKNGARNGHKPGFAPRSVLVTSPTSDPRTSEVAANLAAAFGETGRRTTLVSADLRAPRVHSLVGSPAEPGLLHLIEGGDAAASMHATSIPHVTAVPSGGITANPAGVLASEATSQALDALRALGDATIVVAGGLLDGSDPAPLLPQVDGVVLVARAGRTRHADAAQTSELLKRSGVELAGVVLIEGRP